VKSKPGGKRKPSTIWASVDERRRAADVAGQRLRDLRRQRARALQVKTDQHGV
jgi:hypothetical protein